jgi:hypothetical protein
LIGGWIIFNAHRIFDQQIRPYKKEINLALILVLVLVFLYSGYVTYNQFKRFYTAEDILLMDYVKQSSQADDLYLIPPELENFRLRTGTPVFVDQKSHPYKDIELIHWYNRIQLAEKFYRAEGEGACHILREIVKVYPVSKVVMKNENSKIDCNFIKPVYQDKSFVVYKIIADN